MHKWQKHLRDSETQLTWQVKHSEAATADRKAAADQRVFESLGAQPAGDGKYKCPHCSDPPVCMYLRSLRKHVAQCQNLSQEVRDRQAAQRAKGEVPPLAPPPRPAPAQPVDPAPAPPVHFTLHTLHFTLSTPHSTL